MCNAPTLPARRSNLQPLAKSNLSSNVQLPRLALCPCPHTGMVGAAGIIPEPRGLPQRPENAHAWRRQGKRYPIHRHSAMFLFRRAQRSCLRFPPRGRQAPMALMTGPVHAAPRKAAQTCSQMRSSTVFARLFQPCTTTATLLHLTPAPPLHLNSLETPSR